MSGCQNINFTLNATNWKESGNDNNSTGICFRGFYSGSTNLTNVNFIWDVTFEDEEIISMGLDSCGLDIYCDGSLSCRNISFYGKDVVLKY